MRLKSGTKKRLSRMEGRLRREGRRFASMMLCGVLVAGNLSAVPVLADSDSDNEYTYEIERTAMQEALQTAVSEGNAVNEDLEFAGEHAEEYAQLLEADGTLYELKLSEDEIDEDEDRDKALNLRIFARIEGDIPLDETYEIDGSEEIVFLLSNKTEETVTAAISVDSLRTDAITILPSDSIPVEEESTAVRNVEAVTTAVSSGLSTGGAGSGSGGSSGSSSVTEEVTDGTENEIEVTITDSADEYETEVGLIAEDSSVSILDEDDSYSSISADVDDDAAGGQTEDGSIDDANENANAGDTGEAGDTENKDTDNNDSETGDTGSEENVDSSADAADADEGDTSDTEDTDGSDNTTDAESGNNESANDSADSISSGSTDDTSDNDSSSGITEDSDVSFLGSAISIHKGVLLAASKATDSDADETASSSDAARAIDGIVYESVQFDKKGTAAFATTAADLKLDEINTTKSTETVDYIAESDGVAVTVTAPEGALPEGAELSVTVFEEDSDEYAAAGEAIGLDTDDEEAGMAVLDISFCVDGEEVEPDGTVSVMIDASGIVPEDVDTSTIEIQHLVESEDGLEANLVADAEDASDGTVDTETVIAEFVVDSFSSFTIAWGSNNNASLTCNLYDTDGNSIDLGPGSSLSSIILTSGGTCEFVDEDFVYYMIEANDFGSTTTYTLSSVNVVVTIREGGGQGGAPGGGTTGSTNETTYSNVISISYDGSTYTIKYVDDDGVTQTEEITRSNDTTITVNLYYTGSSTGSNNELNPSTYNKDAYVYWDTMTEETDGTYEGADSNGNVDSVYLQGASLDTALSVTHGNSTAKSWSNSTKLSSYFPEASKSSSSEDKSTMESGVLYITPKSGYYVTMVVIACCATGEDPFQCQTWDAGNAFTTSFSVGTGGTVAIDVSSLDFSHSSSDDHYFILIMTAPIPSPLYVEYDYGDIVDLIGDQNADSAFSTPTGWTSKSTEGNNYGNAGEIQTESTQYKYAYNENSSDVENWKHYANTVTDNAKAQAAAAGYVFVGWEAEYYTDIEVAEQNAVTGGYQPAYNNYSYTVEDEDYYGGGSYGENEEVTLTTHVRLIAQWLPIAVELEKTVAGIPEDSTVAQNYGFTVYYSSDGSDGSWTEVNENAYIISVTGSGTGSVYIYPAQTGYYKVEEVSGNDNRVIDGTTYYITVSVGSNAEVSVDSLYASDMNYITITGTDGSGETETESVLAGTLTVTNTYSTSYVTIQKIDSNAEPDDDGNYTTLSGAVFTLMNGNGEYYDVDTGSWVAVADGEDKSAITLGSITLGTAALTDGTYTLKETDAPDGYNLLSESITFTMAGGSVSIENTNVVRQTDVDGNVTLSIKNTSGSELPETGGPGTTLFRIAGLLLTSCSAYLIYKTLRREGGWLGE